MRILIHPRPTPAYSAGIFLARVASELKRRGYKWTARPFHYFGLSMLPWHYCFLMGTPRHCGKIISSGKPVVLTMGKPQLKEEIEALGFPYLAEYVRQEEQMMQAIQTAPRIVFISEYVRRLWTGVFGARGVSFPPPERVRVIHHGVDTTRFAPAPGLQREPFVLGAVGALRARFRLETLFAVSRMLPHDHRLLIVGSMDDPCRRQYELAMCDPRLRNRTQYFPWVSSEELPQYYRRMHCLFHPVDFEGCGIVVIEALACGVPVVVPAHGAPQEYLGCGGIAVRVPQFTYGDEFCRRMAEAVTAVKDDWDRFSRGARTQANDHLSIRRTMDHYLEFMGLPMRTDQHKKELTR